MHRNCCCCPIVGVLLVQVVLCGCVCARYGIVCVTHRVCPCLARVRSPYVFVQSVSQCVPAMLCSLRSPVYHSCLWCNALMVEGIFGRGLSDQPVSVRQRCLVVVCRGFAGHRRCTLLLQMVLAPHLIHWCAHLIHPTPVSLQHSCVGTERGWVSPVVWPLQWSASPSALQIPMC
jgi:hypothetical protein